MLKDGKALVWSKAVMDPSEFSCKLMADEVFVELSYEGKGA